MKLFAFENAWLCNSALLKKVQPYIDQLRHIQESVRVTRIEYSQLQFRKCDYTLKTTNNTVIGFSLTVSNGDAILNSRHPE